MARSSDKGGTLPTMVSKDGKEWTPQDRAEATNLRARGWTVKGAAKTVSNKSASNS